MELQPMKVALDWSSQPPTGSDTISHLGGATGPMSGPMGAPAAAPAPAAAAAAPGGLSASSIFSSPFASVGVEYGQQLLRDNVVLNSGVGGWLRGSRLRYYFEVDQPYIVRKIGRLVVPYLPGGGWTRQKLEDVDEGLVAAAAASAPGATWQPPKRDLNAPDLYIGLMAFITFIVTMGIALGMADRFEPEMLGITATRSLVCLLFEVGLIYAGFYVSNAPVAPASLDLFALAGYKYVALNLDIFIGVIAGTTAFYFAFFLLGLSTVVFMVRTLNGWVPSSVAALGSAPSSPRFRVLFVAFALCQLLFSLFLLYPALPTIHASRGLGGVWASAVASSSAHNAGPLSEAPSSTRDSLPKPTVAVKEAPTKAAEEPTPVTPVPVPTASKPADVETAEKEAVKVPEVIKHIPYSSKAAPSVAEPAAMTKKSPGAPSTRPRPRPSKAKGKQ